MTHCSIKCYAVITKRVIVEKKQGPKICVCSSFCKNSDKTSLCICVYIHYEYVCTLCVVIYLWTHEHKEYMKAYAVGC